MATAELERLGLTELEIAKVENSRITMPPEHERELKIFLSLREDEKLPERLVTAYFRFRRMLERVSSPPIDANTLAIFLVKLELTDDEIRPKQENPQLVPQPAQDDVERSAFKYDTTDWLKVEKGTRVVCVTGHTGRFVTQGSKGAILVDVDGDSAKHRRFELGEVKLAD